MSKNIKIDAKHATVSEIDKAIDQLKDLRDEKCTKANQKELKKSLERINTWLTEYIKEGQG